MNVCITSVGRRNYLVNWFREAGDLINESVNLIVADGDTFATAFDLGDRSIQLPRFAEPGYLDAIVDLMQQHEVDLLISANDYEISTLSRSHISSKFPALVIPPAKTLEITEDKYATAGFLQSIGIGCPSTRLGSEFSRKYVSEHAEFSARYVVKHRFGSGSSGVQIVPGRLLLEAIDVCAETARDRFGNQSPAPDRTLVVVQEHIVGDEFGIDIICDLDGNFTGVLARRKLQMRSGETDRAITVDARQFESIGARMANGLTLVGITDVDLIVTPGGEVNVIDINTRFGGGYPFCHLAGANVPACYLAWATGQQIRLEWLKPTLGVVGGKYAEIKAVGK